MKCTAIFLVLSMVVLMAQPAEGFLGLIIQGVIHGVKAIHRYGQVFKNEETSGLPT
uniref:Uncharacterized protein n=1 Tax=Oryzias latipes TaxID=8090 RepID=A0A3B3I0B7_ORYLA